MDRKDVVFCATICGYVYGGTHGVGNAGAAGIQAALADRPPAVLRNYRRDVRDSGVRVAEFGVSILDTRREPLAHRRVDRGSAAVRVFRGDLVSAGAFAVT